MFNGGICMKIFIKVPNAHVLLLSDNTDTVRDINNMHSSKSKICPAVISEIWAWAEDSDNWITVLHIPGNENSDDVSRKKTNLEWMLNQKNFWRNLSKFHFKTRVDLFASILNIQLSVYDSYNPDPEAMHINWFFISWLNRPFYAYLRFSVIGRALHEIVLDEAAGIIVLPNWSAQPWYSLLMKSLNNTPILSLASKIFLQQLEKKEQHNLAGKSALQASLILGKNRSNKPFSREYQNHKGE